jgi:hypothetical protein
MLSAWIRATFSDRIRRLSAVCGGETRMEKGTDLRICALLKREAVFEADFVEFCDWKKMEATNKICFLDIEKR